MLLAARQSILTGGGSPTPLPYDAEIEYLESTGTQYIDTGVLCHKDNGFIATCEFLRNTSEVYPALIGAQASDSAWYECIWEDSGGVQASLNFSEIVSTQTVKTHNKFTASINFLNSLEVTLGDSKIYL